MAYDKLPDRWTGNHTFKKDGVDLRVEEVLTSDGDRNVTVFDPNGKKLDEAIYDAKGNRLRLT